MSGSPANWQILLHLLWQGQATRAGFASVFCLIACWLIAWLTATSAQAQTATITSIFGEETQAAIAGLTATEVKLADGKTLPLANVLTLKLADSATGSPEDAQLQTRLGGKLFMRSVTVANDVTSVTTTSGDKLEVPLEHLKWIWLGGKMSEEFREAAAKPSDEVDKIFVKVDQDVQQIRGLVVGLDEKTLTLDFDGTERTLPVENLAGIVVAQIADQKRAAALVTLTGGTIVPVDTLTLADGQLQLESEVVGNVSLPLDRIAEIEFVSDRVNSLTNLTPEKSEHLPLVTLKRPAQTNRNISGGPMVVGKKSFERGFGVASESRLEFDLDDNYEFFVAQVGIDDETAGRGDCVFKVLADGREVWSHRAQGGKAAQPLKVDINGVRDLTLVVETGENLDLADHANWCEPRLIRPQR